MLCVLTSLLWFSSTSAPLAHWGKDLTKGAKIKMKKGWWETGERTIIKSDGVYEICHSKYPQKEYMELQIPISHWMPHKQHQRSVSLQTYLTTLPGRVYPTQGTVVTTDGSLRTRKHTSGEMSMGAASGNSTLVMLTSGNVSSKVSGVVKTRNHLFSLGKL